MPKSATFYSQPGVSTMHQLAESCMTVEFVVQSQMNNAWCLRKNKTHVSQFKICICISEASYTVCDNRIIVDSFRLNYIQVIK